MHYFQFEAHPKPGSDGYGRLDGAYINCWINDPVAASAEAAAREFVDGCGRDIEALEESRAVTAEEFEPCDQTREYVEQAEIDGLVVVIYSWPVDAPEE